ncbi:hypothetical protein JHD48_04380, partial [Sulfurimonas sp. SAG-AH-194-I05]|nr:hypothetical protein [Sulfurimonas sp. SAG-AH-194-I05]
NFELEEEEISIESEIENAVSELSQADLDSEVDDETLLNIAETELNSFDSLNSRDLKLAVGEEVPELEEVEVKEEVEVEVEENPSEELVEEVLLEESVTEDAVAPNTSEIEITPDHEGVEALKNLLKALSNKDVAASMKGMKISVNIELGDG